jgi:hypothetical protein
MECKKYLVMKCKYIIQINQHFLSLYLVILKKWIFPMPHIIDLGNIGKLYMNKLILEDAQLDASGYNI